MNTLFPIKSAFPEGFTYTPDFLTQEEEIKLNEQIQKIELHTFTLQGFTANRKVASFGYDYCFENGRHTKGKEIPVIFNSLIEKVSNNVSIKPTDFAELLVTEYPVGSVINWHGDAAPFDLISGISLMADCNFRLRPHEKTKPGICNFLSC